MSRKKIPSTLNNTLQSLPAKKIRLVFLAICFLFISSLFFSRPALALDESQPAIQGIYLGRPQARQTEQWLGQGLILSFENKSLDLTADLPRWKKIKQFSYNPPKLVFGPVPTISRLFFLQLNVTNPWAAFKPKELVWGVDLSVAEIYNKFSSEVLPLVTRPAKNAELVIEGTKASVFEPHRIGIAADFPATLKNIKKSLVTDETEVPVKLLPQIPTIQLADLNSLGIIELIAKGESNFRGSSASRITNITVGSKKFKGVILAPGQEFSFNYLLGEVTPEDGFKPEMVIKSTGTVPELGGGLCQVSTTAFRAALYGGLPITARKNHSYAVGYYSPQGTDATIYPGVVDLRFVNDTPAHLIINTYIEDTKLYFEFYGTPDNRKVTVDGPYQYDFGEGGSMKARMSRTVVKGSTETVQDFYSKYVSRNLFPTTYEYPSKPAEGTPAVTTPTEGTPAEGTPPTTDPQTPASNPADPTTPQTEGTPAEGISQPVP